MLSIGDRDVVLNEGGKIIINPKQGENGLFKGVQCTFFIQFGWITLEELFTLRQTDPRIAP